MTSLSERDPLLPQNEKNVDIDPEAGRKQQQEMAFWRRFLGVMRIVWSHHSGLHVCFLATQIGCSTAYAWAYNYLSNNVGSLTGAIASGDVSAFYRLSLYLFAASAVGAVANSLQLSIAEYQYNGLFRQTLCAVITKTYLSNRAYFSMLHLDRSVTDPESRICTDASNLFEKLKLIVVGTPMYAGYLPTTTSVIWFTTTLIREAGWLVAGTVLGVFVVSTLVSLFLMRAPARAARHVDDANSEYHGAHTYLAMHAEHVAFLGGEAVEELKLAGHLQRILPLVRRHALTVAPLNTWTILFYWAGQFYAYFIPGAVWLWTNDPRVSNYTLMVNVGTVAFSLLVVITQYLLLAATWSEVAAITARIGELIDVMDNLHRNPNYRSTTVYAHSVEDNTLSVEKVTLLKPGTKRPMIKEVSLSVGPSNSVVIMGPSGVGKTSILRVLAQLWPADGGCVATPSRSGRGGIMFVPQRPYLTLGTLAEQVAYPEHLPLEWEMEVPNAAPSINSGEKPQTTFKTSYEECLRQVGLGYLIERFRAAERRPWNQILSVGEQQRVGIARVLFHRPAIAVMDESTSAIDEPNEEVVFLALKRCRIALLSVAHRSTVRRFHDSEFLIAADGTWRCRTIGAEGDATCATRRPLTP